MKLTKTIIADIYEEVIAHSQSKLSTLNKTDFVNTVYSHIDDKVNDSYNDLVYKYQNSPIVGLDSNDDDYNKKLLSAAKHIAASDVIWNIIDSRV